MILLNDLILKKYCENDGCMIVNNRCSLLQLLSDDMYIALDDIPANAHAHELPRVITIGEIVNGDDFDACWRHLGFNDAEFLCYVQLIWEEQECNNLTNRIHTDVRRSNNNLFKQLMRGTPPLEAETDMYNDRVFAIVAAAAAVVAAAAAEAAPAAPVAPAAPAAAAVAAVAVAAVPAVSQ